MPATGFYSDYERIEAQSRELIFKSILQPELEREAVKLYVDYIHDVTSSTFSGSTEKLSTTGLLDDGYVEKVRKNAEYYNGLIKHERDYELDYMGILSMIKNYKLGVDGKIFERPQYVYMRVAVQCGESLGHTAELYEMLSRRIISFATPIIANSGTKIKNMISCFLISMEEDSINGIYSTLLDIARLSQRGGGIGVHMHNIRSAYEKISTTGKNAGGILPMLRVYDTSAAYVDQGGRRPGAVSVYLEMHHPEILDFLEVRKNFTQNDRNIKCLFPAIWMPDLFMKRVESDGYWSFFDPKKFNYLSDLYGKEYEDEYETIENMHLYVKQVKARDAWRVILECLINTGLPYIVSKDRVNKCSNQKNLGTIKSSNLCTEIVQYSDPTEISCCTLASVVLPSFVADKKFDYELLDHAMSVIVKSLDHVIDLNDYDIIPDGKTLRSSTRHRPIAVGVVGMADMFLKMRMVFGSENSQEVNEKIAEQMYWSAVNASCELAREKERYITFYNSPLANGIFHFEMWQKTMEEDFGKKIVLNKTLDWESLRDRVKKYGVRNSLFIGHMPTGTTSQILGVHECFEPFTSNIYARRIGAGDITMINKFLVADLQEMGVWNEKTYKEIITAKGSIQSFTHFTRDDGEKIAIPVFMKSLYRTVYEVKPKRCIDMIARRSPYIDQSSSNNIYYPLTSVREMTKTLFYAWRSGLKTIQYYARTSGAIDPIQFTCISCST